MNYTIHDLTKHFEIKKEEVALLFLFLTLIPPGETVEAFNGAIKKITETTFELSINEKTLRKIADDFLMEEESDDYDKVFRKTKHEVIQEE